MMMLVGCCMMVEAQPVRVVKTQEEVVMVESKKMKIGERMHMNKKRIHGHKHAPKMFSKKPEGKKFEGRRDPKMMKKGFAPRCHRHHVRPFHKGMKKPIRRPHHPVKKG